MNHHEVIKYGIEYLVKEIEKARATEILEDINHGQVAVYMQNRTIYKSVSGRTGLWLALCNLNNAECDVIRISANKNTIKYQKVDFKKLNSPEDKVYE